MSIRFLTLASLLAAPAAHAQAPAGADPSPHSAAELIAPVATIQAAQPFEVALRITTDPGWHVYWTNPGDAGAPPTLAWEVPAGFAPEAMRFPFPERIELPPLASYGYEDELVVLVPFVPPASVASDAVTLRARAEWLVCADVCLPAEQDVSITLPVSEATPAPDARWVETIDAARVRLPVADPSWRVAAAATDAGYELTVSPPEGWSGEAAGAYFFVDTTGVVEHAGAQTLAPAGAGFRLSLPSSEYANGAVPRLAGVLVLPEGSALDVDGRRALAVDVAVAGAAAEPALAAAGAAATGAAPLSLVLALLFALAGGALLNLMPCVFPVLSIKLLGFAQGREGHGADLRRHGYVFALGVVVSFLVLAGALLALRAAGAGLGWGFQLQSPGVIAFLALLMFVLGLNLAGVFEVGFGLAGIGGRLDRKTGLGGAFLSGVLAVVVATPCTAPFMGAALGYAFAQPAIVALAVFTALGLGMALPYVLLASFPSWLDRLPRPGPWMASLKQALAFPLFATTVWLVWVFGQQTGVDGAAMLLFSILLASIAGWLVGRWDRTRITRRQHAFTRGLAAVAAGLALWTAIIGARFDIVRDAAAAPTSAAADVWRPYDPAAVESLVAAGRPVFVDFTAAWCLSCQVNKRVALHTAEVEDAFRRRGVATFRADWTSYDPAITAAIDALGRSGVPVYALYAGAGGPPVLLPELLTPAIVLEALEAVAMPATASVD